MREIRTLICWATIWVKGLNKKTAAEWIEFCRGFSERTAADGLFVLEVHGDVMVSEAEAIRLIDFSACVSSYDVQLFNSFILDEQDMYSDLWKKYVSTCAATVCDIDAEISELLIRVIDFKTESVIEGIKRISEMPEFSRRGKEDSSCHILRSYRNGDAAELEHRIWVAQIQVLFPIIELERVSFIQKYEADIQKVLDREEIIQYGEVLREAVDVELGSLCYLMNRRYREGFYLLYIPDESDRKRIGFLHDCRNRLVHVSCCSPEQVLELLG